MNIKQIDGYPVVDATEPLILEVTRRDITKGEPQEPDSCAIARACKRTLDIIEARVHLSRTYLRTSDGEWLRYFTPQAARTEIVAFDRGGTFEPGEYRFPPVSKSKRLGTMKSTSTNKRTGRKRTRPHVMTNIRGWN